MFGINTKLHFHRESHVHFGDRLVTEGRFVVITDAGATLDVGERVYFNEGAMISCKKSVRIGAGCRFGPNVKIFDNNHKFNSVYGVLSEHTSGDVEIGTGCWIGANVVILKGTRIGDRCVVGAGCVISGDIPPESIVTQNRELKIESMHKSYE